MPPKEEQNEERCFVVIMCAVAADRSFMVFTKPLAIYREESDAKLAASAEQERKTLYIQNRECFASAAVIKVPGMSPPPQAREGYVVYSNAYLRNGSGGTMARVDGVFGKEERAREKLSQIQQGMQKVDLRGQSVKGQMAEVLSEIAKVPIL